MRNDRVLSLEKNTHNNNPGIQVRTIKKNECESKNLPVSLGHLRTKGRGENSEVEREEKLKLKNLN